MTRWKRWTIVTATTAALGASVVVAGPAATSVAVNPTYDYTTVVSGLAIPWDVTWVGTTMLYDQRAGGLYALRRGGTPHKLHAALPKPLVKKESGMLGMVADPHAATNRLFYTCQSVRATGDIRVLRWRLDADAVSAVRVGKALITGIPFHQGRHNGCRLRFSAKGMLYVGTGDAAVTGNPQSRSSLGGKVLRIHPDGRLPATNPYARSKGNARYIWNVGHRNVQGLALQPGTGRLYSAEQGTDRDDEVNLVRKGRNYGWQPGPGYDEHRPMTDKKRFPHAVSAIWSSGYPTKATSGITFLSGSGWQDWDGALAVAQLKGTGIRLLFLSHAGNLVGSQVVPGSKAYGRVRAVQQGPDGALYFTTSNSEGSQHVDKIVRVALR